MAEIKLSRGKVARVDDLDYEKVSKFRWHYNNGYARISSGINRKYLHQFIMNPKKGQMVDHINRDTLDCRRSNLRITDMSGNMINRPLSPRNKSGYRGVSYYKPSKCWRATIMKNRVLMHLGHFKNKVDAALAYNEMALKLHGSYANLNNV
jgi:hypothetical protein